jgi:Tfp pilus assembly protein PilV
VRQAAVQVRTAEGGFSLVEIIVAILILSSAVLSLLSGTILAAHHVGDSRSDMKVWAAMQGQLELLASQGYASVMSGSDSVQNYAMTWTVSGVDPKTVVLVAERRNRRGQTVLDSLVMHFSAADTL